MRRVAVLAAGALAAAVLVLAGAAPGPAAAAAQPASPSGSTSASPTGSTSASPTGSTAAWQPPTAVNALSLGWDVDGDFPLYDMVSCTGTAYCAAVGTFNLGPVTTGWVWDRTDGTWDSPRQIPGLAALNQGGWAEAVAVACASPGNCAAGGSYSTFGGSFEPFVVSEEHGVWGKARALTGIPWLAAGDYGAIDEISCGASGDCVAVGTHYNDAAGTGGSFLVEERDGAWGPVRLLPGGQNELSPPSCSSAGNCVIVGIKSYSGPAFALTESDFRWTAATPLGPDAASGIMPEDVSCWSAGNCVAVGAAGPGPGQAAIRITETDGRWGGAHRLGGIAGDRTAGDDLSLPVVVSCAGGGDCAAVTEDDLITSVGDRWGKPVPVPPEYSDPASVSCSAPGYCSAGAGWDMSSTAYGAVIDEVAGKWQQWNVLTGPAADAPGGVGLREVSCGAPGNCVAVGETYGVVSSAIWVAVKRSVPVTATGFTLSVPRVVYGREQAGRASVSVTASSGTPSGTATVTTGAVTACTVTLTAGHGACALPATALAAGTYEVTGDYGVNAGFAYSRSAPVRLVVAKAPTVTRLALGSASASYGHEGSDRISVSVTPRYAGLPAGSVLVKNGTATLCVIKLHARKGTCELPAKRLKPGRYRLTAQYAGGVSFSPSTSAADALTVTG